MTTADPLSSSTSSLSSILSSIDPPPYDGGSNHAYSPPYSPTARVFEIPFESDHSDLHWCYSTEHMRLYLDGRLERVNTPSYGKNADITGNLVITGLSKSIEEATITLVGLVENDFNRTLFIHDIKNLYDHVELSHPNSSQDIECSFKFTIPSEVTIGSCTSPPPPSFLCVGAEACYRITYFMNIRMSRKVLGMHRVESKSIPILYLPKSNPELPPMSSIPPPPSSSVYPNVHPRVLTVPVLLKQEGSSLKEKDLSTCSVNFSLPTPKVYASGDEIPFALSLVFPSHPALPNLLLKHTRIVLVRRVMHTRSKAGIEYGPLELLRECHVSSGTLQLQREYEEGVLFIRGVIRAGTTGKHRTFSAGRVLQNRYVIRISVKPSKHLADYLPEFYHEEEVELTTDQWDTIEQELKVTNGVPLPALGLTTTADVDEEWTLSPSAIPM